MAKVIFDNLKPQYEYIPIKVGKAEVVHSQQHNAYALFYDGEQWMTFHQNNNAELKDFYIEINLAKGKVVTTGLGFGLLQTTLAAKKNVKEVIVYEKYPEIIEIFNLVTQVYNIDTSKIKIINEDANNLKDVECDWLIMDHFEATHQTHWEILDSVRKLAAQNNAKNTWFWPFVSMYRVFCTKKRIPYDEKSYDMFIQKLNVMNMPKSVRKEILQKIPDVPEFKQTAIGLLIH